MDAVTGELVYEERLPRATRAAGLAETESTSGERSERGGRSSGRSRGGQDYSSPVVAADRLYYVTRSGTVHVLQLGSEFKPLAQNQFDNAGSFAATPAISDGQIFFRSSRRRICIAHKK